MRIAHSARQSTDRVCRTLAHFGTRWSIQFSSSTGRLYVDFHRGDLLDPADATPASKCSRTRCRTDVAADVVAFMTTMDTNLETLIDAPNVEGLALRQNTRAAGSPKPPGELMPALMPAPANARG